MMSQGINLSQKNFQILGEEKVVRILELNEIDSTNEYLKRLVKEGETEILIVRSDFQSKGHGKYLRPWVSPAGENLLFSLLMFPDLSVNKLPEITLLTTFCLSQVVTKLTGCEFHVKKPNDLMYEDKKVAGVLTEVISSGSEVRGLIVGIGLNVNSPVDQLPELATSLVSLSQQTWDIEFVFYECLQVLLERYQEFFGELK